MVKNGQKFTFFPNAKLDFDETLPKIANFGPVPLNRGGGIGHIWVDRIIGSGRLDINRGMRYIGDQFRRIEVDIGYRSEVGG